MSLLLLIDGYNVIAPVAAPGRAGASGNSRWLEAERKRLLRRLIEHLPESVRTRTCVVFDARSPPPGAESQMNIGGIEIRFAVDEPEADDLIEKLIIEHSAPKQLAVVSSDHRLKEAARRRGAVSLDSDHWLDELLEGRVTLATGIEILEESQENREGQGGCDSLEKKPTTPMTDTEVEHWLREFGFDPREI